MNPFAVALENALARSPKTRAELSQAFDEALADLEFAADAQAVVLPVTLPAAGAWVDGQLTDVELLMTVTDEPEAIWWAALPRRGEFYAALEESRQLFYRGARALVARTKNPVVAKHMARFGFRPVLIGEEGGNRWFGGADAVTRWLRRVTVRTLNAV